MRVEQDAILVKQQNYVQHTHDPLVLATDGHGMASSVMPCYAVAWSHQFAANVGTPQAFHFCLNDVAVEAPAKPNGFERHSGKISWFCFGIEETHWLRHKSCGLSPTGLP